MQKYQTNINKRINNYSPQSLWPNITLSETTKERRGRIRGLLDDFCLFQWRGHDAFESFGVFILNEKKGSLKFYNGPNYSNEYTKPQFSSYASNLTGIKFDQQKISFKIAVYWITAKDYRIFMDYLSPYAIDYLSFAWDYNWGYLVKLTGCKDTAKHIIGYEGKEPMYYTEIDLNFEIQGPACARTTLPMHFEKGIESGDEIPLIVESKIKETREISFEKDERRENIQQKLSDFLGINIDDVNEIDIEDSEVERLFKPQKPYELPNNIDYVIFKKSDQETLPIVDQKISGTISANGTYPLYKIEKITATEVNTETMTPFRSSISITPQQKDVSLQLKYGNDSLFKIVVSNLNEIVSNLNEIDSNLNEIDSKNTITIEYDSETGLLFLAKGSQPKLLSLVTTTSNGNKIISSMEVKKYYMKPEQDSYEFKLIVGETDKEINHTIVEDFSITMYGRRNIA